MLDVVGEHGDERSVRIEVANRAHEPAGDLLEGSEIAARPNLGDGRRAASVGDTALQIGERAIVRIARRVLAVLGERNDGDAGIRMKRLQCVGRR